jgi:hypothetical protein
MAVSVESLVAFCRKNDRVCPLPPLWNRLWEMLPERTRFGAGWQPPPPLILAAWHDTPAMLKMLRLAEHIEWAAKLIHWRRSGNSWASCASKTGIT